MNEFQISSNHIVTPQGIVSGFIHVRAEKIQTVTPQRVAGVEIKDWSDAYVSPGVVDTHAHLNEPGRTEWEGFETATRAAAAGGVTSVVDMPLNCIPATTTCEALRLKQNTVRSKAFIDYGFWGGVVPGNSEDLNALMTAGVCGFKAFLIDSGVEEFPHCKISDLEKIMPLLARRRFPLLVHAEMDGTNNASASSSTTNAFDANTAPRSEHSPIVNRGYRNYLQSRPPEWELTAIRQIINLSRKTTCAVHIVHLSTALALRMITEAKASGIPITVETCPHYLCFDAESIGDGQTLFKCAPPIREAENREALWRAVALGEIDCIVSDHSPCNPELKLSAVGDFTGAWGGIAGLQFSHAVVWTEGARRGMTAVLAARLMSQNPAILAGLAGKGAILPGYDADFMVWSPDESFTVRSDKILHRHTVSPYIGRVLKGKVLATYLRGEIIYDDGKFQEHRGQLILRGRGTL